MEQEGRGARPAGCPPQHLFCQEAEESLEVLLPLYLLIIFQRTGFNVLLLGNYLINILTSACNLPTLLIL